MGVTLPRQERFGRDHGPAELPDSSDSEWWFADNDIHKWQRREPGLHRPDRPCRERLAHRAEPDTDLLDALIPERHGQHRIRSEFTRYDCARTGINVPPRLLSLLKRHSICS